MTTPIRDELARCLSSLEPVRGSSEAPSRFRGVLEPSSALAGPPGRLHGGLHPAARLLVPFERVTGRDAATCLPFAMEVRVRRGIELGARHELEGSLAIDASGTTSLVTRVDGTDRLEARLHAPVDDASAPALEHFRHLVADDRRAGTSEVVVGHGHLEVRVGARLVSFDVDEAFASRREVDLVRFLGPDAAVDPTFLGVALDVIGAYALGTTLRTRLFTTHLSLVVCGTGRVTREQGFVVLGDRLAEDVPGSTIEPVEVHGQRVGERRVAVLLADSGLVRAIGYGFVSLVPIRPE